MDKCQYNFAHSFPSIEDRFSVIVASCLSDICPHLILRGYFNGATHLKLPMEVGQYCKRRNGYGVCIQELPELYPVDICDSETLGKMRALTINVETVDLSQLVNSSSVMMEDLYLRVL